MFSWNDLKYFVAVARHKSTHAAARALGQNQSTVQRRLAELENRIGQQLVRRRRDGYHLTELGEAMLPGALAVEAAVLAFQRDLEGAARTFDGVVRLTCPEPIVYRITESGLLERFRERYSDLSVEFVMSDRYVDLMGGEADVALRSGDTTDGDLVGLKIADSIWAVYASRSYVQHHGRPESLADLARHRLIGLEAKLSGHRTSQWLREIAPDAEFAARSDSVLGLVSAARSGVGVAPLPIALGDSEPDLVRVLEPVPELTRSWRLLCDPAMRRTRKIAAFFDFIASEKQALRPILTG